MLHPARERRAAVSRTGEEQRAAAPREEADLGFDKDSKVNVKEVPDKQDHDLPDPKFWELTKPITYRARRDDFTAAPPMHTDFASVPRMFGWFLPRYGRYTKAAILHDHLWQVEVEKGPITCREADGILRQAMRQLEVPFLRRWIMWTAVRWVSLFKRKDRAGWLKDAPLVLLISILALPIVFPPAILVMVSLVLFWGIEWIVYPFLKLAERSKGADGKRRTGRISPSRQANHDRRIRLLRSGAGWPYRASRVRWLDSSVRVGMCASVRSCLVFRSTE